jgi:hypothetical protein
MTECKPGTINEGYDYRHSLPSQPTQNPRFIPWCLAHDQPL